MANYNNQIPSTVAVGDIITITTNGNYGKLPRGNYEISAYSAGGGYAGWVYASYLQTPGVTQQQSQPGGVGGNGIGVKFSVSTTNDISINVTCGAKGTDANQTRYLTPGTTGPVYGMNGTAGAQTSVSINGKQMIVLSGGQGGTGAKAAARESLGSANGSVRDILWDLGTNGANGVVSAANTTYNIIGSNASNGYVSIRVLKLNNPPSEPKPLTIQSKAYSNRAISLSCGASIDPDGDTVQYVWEQRIDSGAWTTAKLSNGMQAITDEPKAEILVSNSGTNIQFRVKAIDNNGGESIWVTADSLAIIYNYPPTISGVDQNKGNITAPFSYSFSVDDPDPSDTISVVIRLDNEVILEITNAVRKQVYPISLMNHWLYLSSGPHTLSILAKDDKGAESTRKITFTRIINGLELESIQAIESNEFVTSVVPIIQAKFPNGCIPHYFLKNDDASSWEEVISGQVHDFVNTRQTTTRAHVWIRIVIERPTNVLGEIVFSGATLLLNAANTDDLLITEVKANTLAIEEMKPIGIQRTIQANEWVKNGDHYCVTILDARIHETMNMIVGFRDFDSIDIFQNMGVSFGITSNGQYSLYARNPPETGTSITFFAEARVVY